MANLKDCREFMDESIKTMIKNTNDIQDFWARYKTMFHGLLDRLSGESMEELLLAVLDCQKRGGTIYTLGNGGSALNSQHIATGLSFITKRWKRPIRCISLCDNICNISSLSNDYGYDSLYAKQLEIFWKKEDLAIFLSTSGNSRNLI